MLGDRRLVYALASAAPRVRLRGVANESLRVVTVARITAIVGDVSRAPKATRANAVRYDDLMRRLAAAVPSLLPVRFGTVVGDEELAFILTSRGASLREALRHVRNRAQMTLRVFDVRSQIPNPKSPIPNPKSPIPNRKSPIPTSETRPTTSRRAGPAERTRQSGAEYLRGRAARARVAELDPLRGVVRRWVRDERVERHNRIVTLHHLVPRTSAGAYRRALERALGEQQYRAVISGPHPPYAFAEI